MPLDIKKVARPKPFTALEKPNAPAALEPVRSPRFSPPFAPQMRGYEWLRVERWRNWAQVGERLALILGTAALILFFVSGQSAVGLAVWMFFITLFVWLAVAAAVFLGGSFYRREAPPPLARGGGVVARQIALLVFLAASVFLLWRAVAVVRLF